MVNSYSCNSTEHVQSTFAPLKMKEISHLPHSIIAFTNSEPAPRRTCSNGFLFSKLPREGSLHKSFFVFRFQDILFHGFLCLNAPPGSQKIQTLSVAPMNQSYLFHTPTLVLYVTSIFLGSSGVLIIEDFQRMGAILGSFLSYFPAYQICQK